jgi:hypothetical protein
MPQAHVLYFGRVSHAAYPHPQNLSETTDFVIIFIDDAQERKLA